MIAKRLLILILVSSLYFSKSMAQTASDEQQVRDVLQAQVTAWNAGNVDEFMKGYAKTDSIMFIGSKGITYGWDSTLAHYKQKYPNKAAMGTLSFDIKEVKQLSPDYFFVVGKFTLVRAKDTPSGHFDLLFRKINGKWYVISDHTS